MGRQKQPMMHQGIHPTIMMQQHRQLTSAAESIADFESNLPNTFVNVVIGFVLIAIAWVVQGEMTNELVSSRMSVADLKAVTPAFLAVLSGALCLCIYSTARKELLKLTEQVNQGSNTISTMERDMIEKENELNGTRHALNQRDEELSIALRQLSMARSVVDD